MGDTPDRKGCLHGESSRSQEEEQEERESVWKAVRIRVQASVCEAKVGRRDPGSVVVQGNGSQSRYHSTLGESVSGTGGSRVAEWSCPGWESAENSRTCTREDRPDQEARTPLWSQADFPSFEACVLPQREPRDGPTNATGRIVDRPLQKETPA